MRGAFPIFHPVVFPLPLRPSPSWLLHKMWPVCVVLYHLPPLSLTPPPTTLAPPFYLLPLAHHLRDLMKAAHWRRLLTLLLWQARLLSPPGAFPLPTILLPTYLTSLKGMPPSLLVPPFPHWINVQLPLLLLHVPLPQPVPPCVYPLLPLCAGCSRFSGQYPLFHLLGTVLSHPVGVLCKSVLFYPLRRFYYCLATRFARPGLPVQLLYLVPRSSV